MSREEGYYSSGSQTNSHTEHFTHDGNSIDLAFNEDFLPVRRYLWNPVNGELLTDERASWVTGQFYGTYWSANDHLGTVRQLLDEAATIAEHREYDSFGEIDAVFSSVGGSRPVANMFSSVAHAGRMWDDDSGLYYNSARWYDPAAGRFLNEDPARDGSNWYVYAGNDPINFYDPTGLSAQGHPLSGLYGSFDAYAGGYSGGKISAAPSPILVSPTLNYNPLASLSRPAGASSSSRSTGTLVDLAFPVGPVNTVSRSLTPSQKFSSFANSLGEAATARALADIAESRRHRTTPSRGIALDQFVDSAFAAAGNFSRGTGNLIGSGIEYATSGYGGRLGDFVAGLGGGVAHLARTAGNIGAVVDLPRTIQATVADVRQGIQIGREHGVTLGVGHFIGTNQVGQYIAGSDFAGQPVDINTLAEGFGRLGGAAALGAGGARLLYQPKGVPLVSNSFYNVADNGLDLTTYRPTQATFPTGSFSITRQKLQTYPSGVAIPQGPFRILDDVEYEAARMTKDIVNNSLRDQYDLRGSGMDIHEIHPVKFGGSPTDLRNKALLDQDYHRQVVTPWWNSLQREVQRRK